MVSQRSEESGRILTSVSGLNEVAQNYSLPVINTAEDDDRASGSEILVSVVSIQI